jgi:uncharacterized membrane protein
MVNYYLMRTKIPKLSDLFLSTHVIFAVIALTAGLIFIHIIPPLWGIDEVTHFSRVYQLSGGHLRSHKFESQAYGYALPANLVDLNNYVYSDLTDNQSAAYFYQKKDVDSKQRYADLTNHRFAHNNADYSFTGATVYSPAAYIGPLLGVWVARVLSLDIGGTITAARIATLLLYVALVYGALRLIRNHRIKWLIFTIALLPSSVFQASIVNVDSLALGESLAVFALLIRLWTKQKNTRANKWELATLAILTVCLPLTKLNYAFLLLPVLFLPRSLWKDKVQELTYKAAILVSSFAILVAWTISTKDIAGAISLYTGSQHNLIDPPRQLEYLLTHPLHAIGGIVGSFVLFGSGWTQGFFGILGWNYVFLPMLFIVALIVTLTLATLYGNETPLLKGINKTSRWVLMLAGALSLLSIIGVFYLTYTPVGAALVGGVQGRYFVPIAAFLFFGFTALLSIRLTMSNRMANTIFISIPVISLLSSALIYFVTTY